MDLIRWYLFCRLFVLVFAGSLKPQMSQTELAENILRFECKVEDYDNHFKVHFNCNIKGQSKSKNRCMENCRKVSESGIEFQCQETVKNNSITIRYEINKNLLPSGDYNCEYKDSESSLHSYTLKNITTITMILTSTSTFLPSTVPTTKSFVQIELVFVLLGIFALSIFVNIAFIIRCILVRRYLDRYNEVSRRKKRVPGWSWVTCFYLKEELKATDMYYKTREDPYDKIRDHPSSETSKSKSSITNDYIKRPNSQDTEKLCFSSNTSQISRSSTFPARQSILVHTPTDQFSVSALPGNTIDSFQPFMIQYTMDPNSKIMMPIINTNRRMSSHCIYDDVPGEHIMMNPSSTMPIRHFASTGSLQNRSRQSINMNLKTSPLPEETQISFTKFNKEQVKPDEEIGLMMNDCSSVLQDYSGSEETYLSGKDSDSMKDPVRVAKLEMSREMMAKADTLLREAHNLLKMS